MVIQKVFGLQNLNAAYGYGCRTPGAGLAVPLQCEDTAFTDESRGFYVRTLYQPDLTGVRHKPGVLGFHYGEEADPQPHRPLACEM